MAKTAIATYITARGTVRSGSRASSDMLETVSIPVYASIAIGIETVSNLSEEARDPLRTVPRAVLFVAIAVFAIYFTLPWIALSAMPVVHTAHDGYKTLLGLKPTETFQGQHGYQNDPVLGLVNNLGISSASITHALRVYLGILAPMKRIVEARIPR